MAQQNQREHRMKLLTAVLLFSCCTMAAVDEVQKPFDQNLSLPCNGCDHSQNCYSVINGNVTNTGSLITQNGSILLQSHTWNVYGSVCCGSNLEQLLCHTVCPRYQYGERCEACKLMLSTDLSSVNNTIRVTKGEEVSFNVTFTHQDHNGFTFTVNNSITHPNFSCTSMKDTDVLTQALMVQYHCVVMELGTYLINSYVTFCNFDYYSPTVFTVIAENTTSVTSSTSASEQSTSSTSSRMVTSQTISSGNQTALTTSSSAVLPSTVLPVITITVSSTNVSVSPMATPDVSVTDATEGQDEGSTSNTTGIVIAAICGFIGIVVTVIAVLLLLKWLDSRCNRNQQSTTGIQNDPPMHMGVTQYGGSRAGSIDGNTSGSGSIMAPSAFSTPRTGSAVSISLAYPVPVMSEPTTQVPEDAYTSHQLCEDAV